MIIYNNSIIRVNCGDKIYDCQVKYFEYNKCIILNYDLFLWPSFTVSGFNCKLSELLEIIRERFNKNVTIEYLQPNWKEYFLHQTEPFYLD